MFFCMTWIGCEHPFTTLATEKSISITFGCLTDTAWATPDPAFPTQPRLEASATEKTILLHFQLSSTLSKSNMVMEYPRFWYALPLYRNIFQMGILHLTCLHHVVPSYNESAPCRSLLIPGTCQTRRPLSHSDHTSQPRFKWGIWGYFGYTPIFRQTQLKWALQAHFNGGA